MSERLREVDARGNCSKCGGTHYGTGWYCPMSESYFKQEIEMPEADIRQLQEQQAMMEMPRYKCHKIVHALKIKEIKRVPSGNATVTHSIVPVDFGFAPFEVDLEYIGKHSPVAGGYYVVYDDGYKSFSPAAAFEAGYTRV